MWSMRTLLGSDNYLLDIALYENNEGTKRPEVIYCTLHFCCG